MEVIPNTNRALIYQKESVNTQRFSNAERKLTLSAKTSSKLLTKLNIPTLQITNNTHSILSLCSKPSKTTTLNNRLSSLTIKDIGEYSRIMTNRSNHTTTGPDLLSDPLQRSRSRVIDQSGVASGGIENAILRCVQVGGFGHIVQLLAEVAVDVVPDYQVVAVEEVGCLGEPVRGVGACFGGEVDFEAGGYEDIVGV
jgi:hypothetical protein